MLNRISNTIKSYNSTGSSMIKDIEDENIKNESFFKEIENWRNVEVNYIAKISQIVNNLRDRSIKPPSKEIIKDASENPSEKQEESEFYFCANAEFAKILQIVIDNHKSFLSKINYDIFLVNVDSAQKILEESKKFLDEQKQQQKEINSKRDILQKVLGKREKLKKQKEEEEMLQIFLLDSVDTTMDQKIRKKNRIKQIEKEADEFEVKVKETVEDYKKLYEKNKENINRIKHNYKQQNRCKVQTLLKVQLHLNTYWKNLIANLEEYSHQTLYKSCQELNQSVFTKMERKEDQITKKLAFDKIGFVENSLKLINESYIEELLEYSKDKDIKTKIKRMMESNDVNPEETDQVSRQVKLIKKMLLQEEVERKCIDIFKNIINKNSKLRMNFVFILQFFRINNQFEIGIGQIHSLHCLISEFLESCYNSRDSFVLKQLMILLMTYYVNHIKQNNEGEKIYIIHFFKKNSLWKDIEYWESILVECIYLEKRNTIKMIVSQSGNMSRRKELLEAERLAILNQMLMVVRNMVIFQYTEKQVKNFALRFIKLLKQDEKFQKDVYNTIEEAVKQETKLLEEQRQSIKEYYVCNLIKQKSEEYAIPEQVRKSYTS